MELRGQAPRWAFGVVDAIHHVLFLMVQTLDPGHVFDSSECCARENVLLFPILQMRKWNSERFMNITKAIQLKVTEKRLLVFLFCPQ